MASGQTMQGWQGGYGAAPAVPRKNLLIRLGGIIMIADASLILIDFMFSLLSGGGFNVAAVMLAVFFILGHIGMAVYGSICTLGSGNKLHAFFCYAIQGALYVTAELIALLMSSGSFYGGYIYPSAFQTFSIVWVVGFVFVLLGMYDDKKKEGGF